MSVELEILETYFESNGFLVQKLTQDGLNVKKKKSDSFPKLLIFNPSVSHNSKDLAFRLFTGDLIKIRSAKVFLLGWENSSFTNAYLNSESALIKFFRQEIHDSKSEAIPA